MQLKVRATRYLYRVRCSLQGYKNGYPDGEGDGYPIGYGNGVPRTGYGTGTGTYAR